MTRRKHGVTDREPDAILYYAPYLADVNLAQREQLRKDIDTALEFREHLREMRMTAKEKKRARAIAKKAMDLLFVIHDVKDMDDKDLNAALAKRMNDSNLRWEPSGVERVRAVQYVNGSDEPFADFCGVGRDLQIKLRSRAIIAELDQLIKTIETVTSTEWRGNPSSYRLEKFGTVVTIDGAGELLVDGKIMSKWRGLSPKDWFVGYALAQIFERYFGEPAQGGQGPQD
jgi:hypothetical protein